MNVLANLIALVLGIVLLYFGIEFSSRKKENYLFGIFLLITGFILVTYAFGLIKIG